MRLGKYLLVFVIGIVTGAGVLGAFWYSVHSTTDVWVANKPMKTSDGILIPPGTEFVLKRWAPEGYVALELSVNVEGGTLKKFDRRTEKKSFLRLPYWLRESDQ